MCSQAAAVFCEIRAHVGNCASVVVGRGFDEDCDSEGSISFICDFLVVARIFIGCLLDCAFDGVFRHVGGFGVLHQHTQTRVGRRVGTSGLDGDGDFFTDACERTRHVSPAFEFSGFAIFKSSSHIVL